ncbi:DUF2855 family protein [Antrihabitans sp. NCIMB 15449]|uniref:DUF2855 family protein n=1 Tax=Antrihabitans spumae TaxID=3373370 RepID=A0ABW7JSI3_9NOCA
MRRQAGTAAGEFTDLSVDAGRFADVTFEGVDLLVRRDDPRISEVRAATTPDPQDGEVVVEVQRFALTANNVTYATAGDVLGYWQFYPAPDGWGRVPAWGFAEVVASSTELASVGDRLYGFWPMSTHATITPTGKPGSRLLDATPHRRQLPALYNAYLPAGREDPPREGLESLVRPLFGTAWLIADQLEQAAFHQASTIVLSSASSKTAAATAWCLGRYPNRPQVVGLTSRRNRDYVEGLGSYDATITYDELAGSTLTEPINYVDVAGNASTRRTVHTLFGAGLALSLTVGSTHWEDPAGFNGDDTLPGPTPQLFFAPSQIEKRTEELGRHELVRLIGGAQNEYLDVFSQSTNVVLATTPDDVQSAWSATSDGSTEPSSGIVASLRNPAGV